MQAAKMYRQKFSHQNRNISVNHLVTGEATLESLNFIKMLHSTHWQCVRTVSCLRMEFEAPCAAFLKQPVWVILSADLRQKA